MGNSGGPDYLHDCPTSKSASPRTEPKAQRLRPSAWETRGPGLEDAGEGHLPTVGLGSTTTSERWLPKRRALTSPPVARSVNPTAASGSRAPVNISSITVSLLPRPVAPASVPPPARGHAQRRSKERVAERIPTIIAILTELSQGVTSSPLLMPLLYRPFRVKLYSRASPVPTRPASQCLN